jgi:hypothetical protein
MAPAQETPVVLARMTGLDITSLDLAELAHERSLLRDEPFTDAALFGKLLDELITDRLAGLEASKLDLSKDWSYRSQVRLVEASTALMIYQNEFLLPGLYFDSTQIDSYYQAHIDRYTAPRDQRFIRQITVYKKGFQISKTYITYVDPVYEGWDPKRKIDSIFARLANGEDFAALAYAHSEELRAKATHGQLGWLSPESVADAELLKPFFETPLHMISKPFETEYGWVIMQVTAERGKGPAPIDAFILNDIIMGLKEEIGRKIATALTDSLAAAGTLKYYDAAMAAPDSLIEPGDVMAIVNGRDTLWGASYKDRKHAVADVRTEPYLTRERKEELLRPVIRMMFLYGAMREWGYLSLAEVKDVVTEKRRQRGEELIRSAFSTSTYAPDSAEIARYYRDHIQEYTPERRHQIESAQYSDRDSAQQDLSAWIGGKQPPRLETRMVGPSDLPVPVWNKLAAVTPGSTIGPVAAKGEYWILKLDKILPPRPLHEAWSSIDATMRQQRLDNLQRAWVAKTTVRYQLVRYDDRLRNVRLPSRFDPRFADDTTGAP